MYYYNMSIVNEEYLSHHHEANAVSKPVLIIGFV